MPTDNTQQPGANGQAQSTDAKSGDQGQATTPQGQQQSTLTFDSWLADQPDNVKNLVDTHTQGLRSALDSERTAHKDLDKKLKDAIKATEKGSDERQRLEAMQTQLESSKRQADFYDAAHKLGVTNLKLAWLAAQSEGAIDEKGACDFETLKQTHPQLFATTTKPPVPPANAGQGAGGQQAPQGMNDLIRGAAGRR